MRCFLQEAAPKVGALGNAGDLKPFCLEESGISIQDPLRTSMCARRPFPTADGPE